MKTIQEQSTIEWPVIKLRYPQAWWGVFIPAGLFALGVLLGYAFMTLKHWLHWLA